MCAFFWKDHSCNLPAHWKYVHFAGETEDISNEQLGAFKRAPRCRVVALGDPGSREGGLLPRPGPLGLCCDDTSCGEEGEAGS